MKSLPRRLLAALLFPAAVLLLIGIGLSVWLWIWIPTQGKAWLETQLEQRLPVEASIQTLHYTPWDGLRLEQIELRDKADPSLVWLVSPRVTAHPDLLALALRRRLHVRAHGRIQIPCEADIDAVVRTGLNDQRTEITFSMSEVSLQDIQPPAARLIPAPLKAGRIQLTAHLTSRPKTPPRLEARAQLAGITWQQNALRFTGDGRLDADVSPAADAGAPWTGRVLVHLLNGTLDGMPVAGAVDQVQGEIRIEPQAIRIEALTGRALDAPWRLSGSIALDAAWSADLELTGTVDARQSGVRLWPALAAWEPAGTIDVTASCRGPLAQWPRVDLMAQARVHDGAATLPSLAQRVDHVEARAQYDHVEQTVTLMSFSANLHDIAITAQGVLHPLQPPAVHVEARAVGDLGRFVALLPAGHPITTAQGPATAQVVVEGPMDALLWNGELAFDGARLAAQGWPEPLDALRGAIRFTPERLNTDELAFTYAQQPVRLSGAIAAWRSSPQITAKVTLAEGTLEVEAVTQADRILLRTAELVLKHSYLQVQGSVGRTAEVPSVLEAKGTVQLEELTTLPWPPLQRLAAWQPSGAVAVRARISGNARDASGLAVDAELRADRIILRDLPLEAVAVDVRQEQRRLSITLTNALAAEGKLTGQLTLDQQTTPPRMLAEADLTQINLARVSEVVPAWRTRRINGLASLHASILGTANDRATWRGDGWLNAAGEHLGELPLLDRLFNGVFGALADRLGLVSLRKARLVKLAGQWQLAQARISTNDLQLEGLSGETPVVVMFRGSVGLDKTLDFIVEPNLPEQLMVEAPNTSTISRTVLQVVGGLQRLQQLVGQHHLGGTIENPEYQFQVNVNQALDQFKPSGLDRLLDALR